MNTEITSEALLEELDDEVYESTTECHIQAANHFQAAAKHHIQAAHAQDEGDFERRDLNAYQAHRHQLIATQYAEVATMEGTEEFDESDDLSVEIQAD
jgi:hypothetical protein